MTLTNYRSKPKRYEESMQIALSKYIKLQYPNVLFTAESSGIRVPIGTAVKMKAQRSTHTLPDMLVMEPRGPFHGLILELKKYGESPWKKNGQLKEDRHIQDQSKTINLFIAKGYCAEFAVGLNAAIKSVDTYMALPPAYGTRKSE